MNRILTTTNIRVLLRAASVATAAGALLATTAPMSAQSLESRVRSAASNATVRFSYPTRPGVCGDGDRIVTRGKDGDNEIIRVESRNSSYSSNDRSARDELLRNCTEGPAHVEITRSGAAPATLIVSVGGTVRTGGTDLGSVSAADAVTYLLDLAIEAPRKVGQKAIFAATLANAAEQTTSGLIAITGRRQVPTDVRKDAVFWLSQSTEPRATVRLKAILADQDENLEVRKSAVFALSQQRNDDAVNAVLAAAKGDGPAELRKDAIFWLGQIAADRATAGLKSILADGSTEMEVREAALFALSQQKSDASIVTLIDVAKTSKEPKLRRTAMFWLGQRSDDPRVMKLFEDILLTDR